MHVNIWSTLLWVTVSGVIFKNHMKVFGLESIHHIWVLPDTRLPGFHQVLLITCSVPVSEILGQDDESGLRVQVIQDLKQGWGFTFQRGNSPKCIAKTTQERIRNNSGCPWVTQLESWHEPSLSDTSLLPIRIRTNCENTKRGLKTATAHTWGCKRQEGIVRC